VFSNRGTGGHPLYIHLCPPVDRRTITELGNIKCFLSGQMSTGKRQCQLGSFVATNAYGLAMIGIGIASASQARNHFSVESIRIALLADALQTAPTMMVHRNTTAHTRPYTPSISESMHQARSADRERLRTNSLRKPLTGTALRV